MNKANIPLIIIIFNLSVCLLVFLELYVLPKKEVVEVFERVSLDRVRSGKTGSSSFDVAYLVTQSGKRYHVPDNLDLRLQQGQHFVFEKTFLFSRLSSFIWCEGENGCYIQHIHPLRIYYYSVALHILLAVISLYFLFRLKTGRLKKERGLFAVTGLCIGFLAYFLFAS